MGEIIYPDLSYKINGILYQVHNKLGKYCNEKQYADHIEFHLKQLKLGYEREKILPSGFEGELKGRNKVDFLIDDLIIIEIKAKKIINKEDYYQMRRYLSILNKKLGILINFRADYIHPKRILNPKAN